MNAAAAFLALLEVLGPVAADTRWLGGVAGLEVSGVTIGVISVEVDVLLVTFGRAIRH